MIDTVLVEIEEPSATLAQDPPRRRWIWRLLVAAVRGILSAAEWLLGAVSLTVGLAMLAAAPILQFLSLGYFLEMAARVARTGRPRDGLIGVRRSARIGTVAAGAWLSLTPAWMVASYAHSAELIDPGGGGPRLWRIGLVVVLALCLGHIAGACARGGRAWHFLLPFGGPIWLRRRIREGGLYRDSRDALWEFVSALRFPYYFRLGLVGFVGTLIWIAPSALLIHAGGRFPPVGFLGAIMLAVIVPFLPFLQVRYAVEGRISALFSRRAIRERYRRAPWAFAFSLMVLLIASIPLYLLKIELIPREAAWLESLVFVIFLAPARLLTGWAYARSGRRDTPRHWSFLVLGRLAIIPVAVLYVLVVFLTQYTSWYGVVNLIDQHAFMLPVPFWRM